AAAAEQSSEHPLARAIVQAAEQREIKIPQATDFSASTAVGVRANVSGREVAVGGPSLLSELNLEPLQESLAWSQSGATVLHVIIDGQVAGALGLADEIRPESHQAIDQLHDHGAQVVMITGDAEPVAQAVG